ncbi:integrin alpha-8-like, partial [Anneissia japonica]|uniref:integrin alpha-8-like n=1 Tax=Anneissia japonica TaxID=1529436 RepID=UPI001425A2AE
RSSASTVHGQAGFSAAIPKACAPRYIWQDRLFENQYLIGRCIAALDDLQIVKFYTPCYTTGLRSVATTVHGQAGFSAAIPKSGSSNDFLLGAVGTETWQGSGYKLNFRSENKLTTEKENPYDYDRSLDFNYKGYSLDYITMENEVRYVLGAPRAERLYGMVYVVPNAFDEKPLMKLSRKGEQLGAYFGQSLTVVDLNGDSYDDLVVGAPFYASNEKWESGRIYIYYQDHVNTNFKEPVKITGKRIRSRLGYSLAALGDINADGYEDVGVGAPYDGEDEAGVVYIYQGHMDGIKIEPSQVITPMDLNLNVTSFGAALSGGIDVDDNAYPDVMVGAFQSDKAILLRSRPVITVVASIQPEPQGINLDEKKLQIDGEMVTSYMVKGCLRYNGVNVPTSQEFEVTITLDKNLPSQYRTVFVKSGSSELQLNMTLSVDSSNSCISQKAYIQDNIADKLNPIVITMTYTPVEQPGVSLNPVINENTQSTSSQVYFLNSCKNNICIPDLSIRAKSQKDIVTIGDRNGLVINVTVENKGDKAFSAVLRSDLPLGLGLIGTRRSDTTDIFIDCRHEESNSLLECDIGNPLPARKTINFMLSLSVDDLKGDSETLSFELEVDSLNQENQTTLNNNVANIAVQVQVSATIELKGISNPEQVTFDKVLQEDESEIITEDDVGPMVSHTYEVHNHGPSKVGVTEIEIMWPLKTSTGAYLLYLTEVTTNMGDVCTVSGGVNPKNLTTIASYSANNAANRNTREVSLEVSEPIVSPSVIPSVNAIGDCSSGGCVNVTCVVNTIVGRTSFIVTLKSRLWVNTLLKNDIKETFARSYGSSRVINMPYLISPNVKRQDSLEITTYINPAIPTVEVGTVEIWIIIVSIICGLLLLLLLAAVLYKVGFFKRKTIQTEESNGTAEADGAKNGAFDE